MMKVMKIKISNFIKIKKTLIYFLIKLKSHSLTFFKFDHLSLNFYKTLKLCNIISDSLSLNYFLQGF